MSRMRQQDHFHGEPAMAVADVEPHGPYALCMAQAERHILQSALESFDGDVEVAAASLRITEGFLRKRAGLLGMKIAAVVPVIEPSVDQTPTIELHAEVRSVPTDVQARRVIALPVKKPVALPTSRVEPELRPEMSVHEREVLAAALLEKDLLEEDD